MESENSCLKNIIYEEYIVYIFRAYISPILAISGIPSNILVVIVFSIFEYETPCRFNFYPIWSSFVHIIQLLFNTLIDDFVGRGLKWATQCQNWIQVDLQSQFACKVITYFSDASSLCSAFILMVFSVDRVLSIYYPKRFEQNSHRRKANIILSLTCFLCCILTLPHLIYVNIALDAFGENDCRYSDPLSTGVKYLLYLNIVGNVILPFIFIFITNILILYKLSRDIYKARLNGQTYEQSSGEISKVLVHLAISILFNLLNFPLVVTIILRQKVYIDKSYISDRHYARKIVHLTKLFSSFDSINHAIDFFLYVLFMSTFRQTLKKLFCCKYKLFKKKIQIHSKIFKHTEIATDMNQFENSNYAD